MATGITFDNFKAQYNNKKLTFDIHNVDLAYVNALRRIVISEVPNVAINYDSSTNEDSDINITKNTSSLHNEFLSHRLSLIPLCFDRTIIEDYDPSKYVFKIHKKNTGASVISITSQDIEIYNEQDQKYPAALHQTVFPLNSITKEGILITKLKPNLYNTSEGEELNVTFKARIGTALQHSRWSPVSTSAFFNIVDQEAAAKALQEKYKKMEMESGKTLTDSQKIEIKKQFDTLDAYRHFHKNAYDEPNRFTFIIQTECNLTPQYLFMRAIDILIKKLEDFKANFGVSADIIINKHFTFPNFYEITIKHETHTLLNVLQSIIYNNNIRLSKSQILEYVGYFQPHPLDTNMILKLKFFKTIETDNDFVISFIKENVDKILSDLNLIKTQWELSTK